MNFFTGEQRADTAQFDELIQNTDTALRTPSVIRTLGSLAGHLRAINNTAFLPNKRHGELRIPRNQSKNANLAVIPMSDWEADNAFNLIEQLYDSHPLRWPIVQQATSLNYGLTIDNHEIFDWFDNGAAGEASTVNRNGLRSETAARAQAAFNTDKKGRYFIGTRPILMIRASMIEPDLWSQAAIMAHEEVHAHDLTTDGPMYGTRIYGAASELRGYHVSANLYAHSRYESQNCDSSYRVESLRQHEIGHTSEPFVPTKWLVDQMVALEVI